ncbi:aminotransferase class I/II-fold pyridoxal phosphate-dependent enzyme [Gimesia fumaroli]|uniref:dTDP-3-amino-3,6-dideoxy-alpha-D-galactopyranose transaminase n=1 Tax=Gimesia fumaroli TaxID=2527976 RepID=A0A518I5F7_9PLAN|nr:aminotransferase class I/II-fold pyridoxal phosphate-dependent enzyme [Gimesia fumaroli]QDV48340.1 dTDP-3-amino-3,6-dideoxy-alpha-D-galactopyranose transaminase [Gimesia fumaroli]
MWIRLRLDIGWRDLCFGFCSSLLPGGRQVAHEKLEDLWSRSDKDALACLSVRSGFDLLLSALDLPTGSEVLFSAVTIPDMPLIARAHELIPVPVDLSGSDFQLDVTALRKAVTSKSKVLIVSHLFGARPEMQEILEVTREHGLYVVEDCAQAWCQPEWRGSKQADASLFSFGPIKTVTALGGALCRVSDPAILDRMRNRQAQEPVQPGKKLIFNICKFACLKVISTKPFFDIITALARRWGKSVDDVLGGLTRGFADENLLAQLRQQPSTGTLRLLRHRLQTYNARRIHQRIQHAQRIITWLGLEQSQPELLDPRHSFWLFPLLNNQPERLIANLEQQGFDSTQRGRLAVVPPPADRPELNCPHATHLLNLTVFLPCYPELTDAAVDAMCGLIIQLAQEETVYN